MKNKTIPQKYILGIALKFMHDVYTPLNRYYKSISKCSLSTKLYYKDFLLNSFDSCSTYNLKSFEYCKYLTFDKVIDNIYILHETYHKIVGNVAFFDVLKTIFNKLINEVDF